MKTKNRRGRCLHRPATRIVSLILSLAMLFSITVGIDLSVFANSDDWQYTKLQNGTVEIVGYKGTDLSVEIPSEINEGEQVFAVTSVGDGAFSGCSSIVEIKIPDTVIIFGNMAFADCSELTKITFPNKIISLGEKAFYGCKKLVEIIMPDSIESIGNWAFADCSSLKEISIPDGVTNIGDYTFSNCSNLMKITLPNSVISMGDWAFYKCSSLTEIVIPNSVIDIGKGTFCDCSNLIEIEMPDSISDINCAAFWNCLKLEKITIPNSVISIGNNAFEYCLRLTKIEIPDSVTSIGDYAFYSCKSLKEIKIPDSVIKIGNQAFYNCSALSDITILNNNCDIFDSEYTIQREAAIHGYKNSSAQAYSDKYGNKFKVVKEFDKNDWEYTDKYLINSDGAVTITKYKGNNSDVIVPSMIDGHKVYSIWEYAFSGSSSLTSVIISDGINKIDECAFYECSLLKSVAIPDSVQCIESGVFANCSSLRSITIPESVITIEGNIFHDCSSLESIIVDKNNPVYDSRNNCNAIISTEYNTLISGCCNTIIPNSVTKIGYEAFRGCSSLTNIVIPKSVTIIDNCAFMDCNNLTDIYYDGTEVEWNNIDIYDSNEFLNVNVHFKEENKLPFVDLKGYEYYNEFVNYTSVYNEFLKGTNPPYFTEFSPTAPITRAMFVTILYRMAGEPYANNNPYRTSPFSDIKDTSVYYYDAACWALENGVTTETTFKPFDNVTREQTATFLYRYAQDNDMLGGEDYKNVNLNTYHDGNRISHFAVDAMKWANYNSMITGTEQGYANPQGTTQRIHATKILYGFGKVCNIGNFE